jgi:hypothetical protein
MNLPIFMIAGFETTSFTLVNICQKLAMNQIEQDRLHNEIDQLEYIGVYRDKSTIQNDKPFSNYLFLNFKLRIQHKMISINFNTWKWLSKRLCAWTRLEYQLLHVVAQMIQS